MSEKKVKEKKDKAKINPIMIMIVLMFILIVGLGAGIGYIIMNQKTPATTSTEKVTGHTELEVPPLTHVIEKDFTVNLTDTDAKRYIKLNITLAFTSTKLVEELEKMDSFIRDTVISVLREKKAADFTSKGTEDLKKEFMARINPYLKDGKISDIYFNDILVQ
ncbi:MAG: flagellar basal body-associated FliL family protein [Clostridiaceae bacterium]|nr:flagellar basal body-associated FliL family protein [Clostridiaceae bacterium]